MTKPATPRGRPKDPAKRAAIVAAAQALFMARGYDEVTMEAVALAAGVSKMTVYGHFRDKAALFEAVVRATSARLVAGLGDLDGPCGGDGGGLEQVLVAFGVRLLELVLSPQVAVMSHVLTGVLMKDPALARAFHDAGPGQTQAVLASILAAAAARGELACDDPMAAAEDLISLWQGELPKRLTLGLAPPATVAEIARRARRATAVFLRAYAAPALRG